ncbi:OmpA family protein [Poseidonocella pacifica]|uniref:OmpA family protein n=1 Tax=Poseidonocella pacifica TaxID=871651 RepID=UPI00158745A7|nr:OmpA family protein [Poseidonocella pacifica]
MHHLLVGLAVLASPAPAETISHPDELLDFAAVERGYSEDLRFFSFFSNGGAVLSADGKGIARAAHSIWQDTGKSSLIIVGHADDLGSEAFNLELGMRRAVQTFDLLKGSGGDIRRIAVVSGGEVNSLVPTTGVLQEAHNRRVEIFVSDDDWQDMEVTWLELATPGQEDRAILEKVLGESQVDAEMVSARIVDPDAGTTLIVYQSAGRCFAGCFTGILREGEEGWARALRGPRGSDVELSRSSPLELAYWTLQEDRYCRSTLDVQGTTLDVKSPSLCVIHRTAFVPAHRALVGTWSSGDCTSSASVSLREDGAARWYGLAAEWDLVDGQLFVTRNDDLVVEMVVSEIKLDSFVGRDGDQVQTFRDCSFQR